MKDPANEVVWFSRSSQVQPNSKILHCPMNTIEVIELRLRVKSLISARVKSNQTMFYYYVKDT